MDRPISCVTINIVIRIVVIFELCFIIQELGSLDATPLRKGSL